VGREGTGKYISAHKRGIGLENVNIFKYESEKEWNLIVMSV
jgi:hypothetical protein